MVNAYFKERKETCPGYLTLFIFFGPRTSIHLNVEYTLSSQVKVFFHLHIIKIGKNRNR